MLEELIKNPDTVILDVRTTGEFSGGQVVGSINIPLLEIPSRLEEIKELRQPLVVCCAAGARSAQACQFLSQQDIECYNGGGWTDVNFYKS